MTEKTYDVLVVGAGPTGLCAAYFLSRQGVSVKLIDRRDGPNHESRAMGVQARTLEFYRQFGIAQGAIDLGLPTGAANFWVHGERRVQFSLADMGEGLSPYPFMLTLAQDVHERYLLECLDALGVQVQWSTELVELRQDEERVLVTLAARENPEDTHELEIPWLIGCDGASSATRKQLGFGFGGGTSEGLFFVADAEIDRENTELHVGFGTDSVALLMPVRTSGTQRIIGFVPPELAEERELIFEDVSADAQSLLGIEVKEVNWFSSYKVHHRVADHFRRGRCFIAGDAGHIHSPVGGQGMNTGIGDAMNLAWKLAGVIRGRTDVSVLDTYETERIAFARTLIQTTDGAFQKLSSDSVIASFLRTRIAPSVVRWISSWDFAAPKLFQTISQIRIEYPDSDLSAGKLGQVHAGMRLPWVQSLDNHQVLGTDWQLHVYGDVADDVRAEAGRLGIEVRAFAWTSACKDAGLTEGGVYLLRPDGHVGVAARAERAAAQLRDYAEQHGLCALG